MRKFRFFSAGYLAACLALGAANGLAEPDAGAGVSEFKQMAANPEEARLAALLEKGMSAYEGLRDYRAVFHKQENSNGRPGPVEKIYLKFEKPFKIFLGWMNTQKKGLQVFYERGRHDGKLAVHTPGILSAVRPVIFLDQDSPWVRAGSASYDIEDAGIGTFLYDFVGAVLHAARERKLRVIFSEKKSAGDLDGDRVDVIFRNSRKSSIYFAYRVRVIFDGKTGLPVQMELFDWENRPTGIYAYRDLKLNVGLDGEFKRLINKHLLKVYNHSQ